MKARVFKTAGKNSPPLLYFGHTLPDKNGDYFFLVGNTGFHGDKEFLFDHPKCIGGLVQEPSYIQYLRLKGKIAFLAGDIQQRTFIRCIHSLDPSWGDYSYPITFDFFWVGTNPKIKRTREFLEIILDTDFRGWVFASNQIGVVKSLGRRFDIVELFPNYYVLKHRNIFIDVNNLYEQNYFEHILNHTAVLISTSITEGIFPNSFLEAWSRDIPAIFDRNMASYLKRLEGIEVFMYDGLGKLINKLERVLSNLFFYREKVKEIKSRYIGANPFIFNFVLEEACKNWYLLNGYNWDGIWLGFLSPYPTEISMEALYEDKLLHTGP